jgi:hypothetical protein
MRCSHSVADGVLASLAAIRAERDRLDETELELIDRARRAGATWAEVGAALGLASRQAAEQRRLRLVTAVGRRRQQDLDGIDTPAIAALRAAVAELDRRIGADRRWDRRFTRAGLVRMTLSAAVLSPPGALFSLASDAASDLTATLGRPAGEPLVRPGPSRSAIDRFLAALTAATPVD